MLRYLVDPANAITTVGLLCSSIAPYFALAGQIELAVGAALWAVLADHLDGVVARRTRNRSPDMAKMGKSLDGFGYTIYGAILSAIILVQLNSASLVRAAVLRHSIDGRPGSRPAPYVRVVLSISTNLGGHIPRLASH